MIIAILGRQPALGIAELECLYGPDEVRWFSENSATIDTDAFDFNRLGGTQKAGRIVAEIRGSWQQVSRKLVSEYGQAWANSDVKLTLGISAYGFDVNPRDVQKTGIILKKKLRDYGVSLRLVPNTEAHLNTATSHHNKLGLSNNKVELLVVRGGDGRVVIAESVGAQNITAIAARDQARPRTDAFVGMLPPKLARMMVNMAVGPNSPKGIWDPFCGTGVVLQEATLLGYDAYGSDLSEKMVDYSAANLEWLRESYRHAKDDMPKAKILLGDATSFIAPKDWFFDTIVSESYLGQPFSAPPSNEKLEQVRGNCNHIISGALSNIASQLPHGAKVCLAIPAWLRPEGHFIYLPLVDNLNKLGYERLELSSARQSQLLYYREGQVVARELLLLKRI